MHRLSFRPDVGISDPCSIPPVINFLTPSFLHTAPSSSATLHGPCDGPAQRLKNLLLSDECVHLGSLFCKGELRLSGLELFAYVALDLPQCASVVGSELPTCIFLLRK